MATFARSPFQLGQQVQVNIEGLIETEEKFGAAAAVAGKIVQIDPVSQNVTIVFNAPVSGEHSVTVSPNRVRASN
ncbi:MAG TPA: hypothetical protein VGK54_10780 [Chloroflexota bacterium]|jgi:archaellum component FlaG (FlaF/FlaG flagellin family)